MKTITALAIASLALAPPAAAQAPAPSPSPDGPRIEIRYPPPRTVDRTPHPLTVPGPPSRLRAPAGSDTLRSWRALSLSEGKGRVAVGGTSHDVAPGRTVEGYTVRSVAPGRVVLARATPPGPNAPAGGTELAILTFGEAGGTRVLRVFDQDPTRSAPLLR
jgi:hypothetical protein